MEPATPDAMHLPVHIRIKEAASTLLGFGGRSRILQRFHPAVEQGIKLDAEACYQELNTNFFNTLRIGVALLAGPTVVSFWLYSLGYFFYSPWLFMLCMSPSFFGMRALGSAFEHRYPKRQFEKSGWEGGFKILRNWTTEFPELNKFMVANRIAESFSMFEFDLVQNYVVAKRRDADPEEK